MTGLKHLFPIQKLTQLIYAFLGVFFIVLFSVNASHALEPVGISRDDVAIDITGSIDFYSEVGDSLKVSTAPDADGIVRRIEVQAGDKGVASNWAVFSLANESNEQIERLIVAPRYRLVGSGMIWPDLDSVRITTITPSEGFSLERQNDNEADVFSITLDPGAVITLIAEQKAKRLPKLYVWEPSAYKDTVNSYTLYRGIVLGISGLLAVFLTILFIVKGSAMFPAAAALAWGVLAYVCVDFGFWDKIISLTASSAPVWRASTEVFLAAGIIIFLYAYLSLNRWNSHFSSVTVAWVLGLIILLGIAVAEPSIASGIARFSIALTAIGGAGLITFLALKRFDRAIMLIPTWILVLAWTTGAGMTITGGIANDVVQPALVGGLVLIVLLLGFTVMQHAFAGGALAHGLVSDVERQALALIGGGDIVWDWDVTRDQIYVGDEATHILSTSQKKLNGPSRNWVALLHPNDRDRLQATLDAVLEHRRGRISQTFRVRAEDGHYNWFKLRARPMLGSDNEVIRCIGSISEVTAEKNAEERLLHDAVHDNLTGLENRELFINRLDTVINFAIQHADSRPSVFHINIDEFREINSRHGFSLGDTILLTVSRRLGRLLKPGDHLSRLGGDQFTILLLSENMPDKIAGFAESIRKSINAPVQFAGQDIVLTASIGIASWTPEHSKPNQMMRDAELAMIQAKRFGGDRIEPFRPAFRTVKDESVILLEDLKSALQNDQMFVLYQPIINLEGRDIVGFEALLRWEHPKLGSVSPVEFIPLAESSGLINALGSYVLNKATSDFAEMARNIEGLNCFVSVNISSRELLRHDIVNDIRTALKKSQMAPNLLRMEVTESLVMENPEHSSEVLRRIHAMGVGLSLDDFGTGYSSLSYLTRFPFDTIKIDKSFIQARDRPERLVVLRAIIAMAHGLNQKIIAEGTEMESDVTELAQMGCEFAQGFLFGEPMDIKKVEEILTEDAALVKT
ncbi:MAG: sensor domain-containing phosphodiesterase [Hyphomicrobiales bacterium]|nr:MAG: sensor domain-containing phosphodiesterase [Hyphomicrobiales bacterium]